MWCQYHGMSICTALVYLQILTGVFNTELSWLKPKREAEDCKGNNSLFWQEIVSLFSKCRLLGCPTITIYLRVETTYRVQNKHWGCSRFLEHEKRSPFISRWLPWSIWPAAPECIGRAADREKSYSPPSSRLETEIKVPPSLYLVSSCLLSLVPFSVSSQELKGKQVLQDIL